jgi:multidrug transporter EmrE-like cation transporter
MPRMNPISESGHQQSIQLSPSGGILINSVLGLAVVSVSLNAMAQIALRKAMLSLGALPTMSSEIISFFLAVFVNLWFYVGMSCYALSIGLWLVVLSKLEVSVAYPLLSIGYVITAVIGFFFLGEDIGMMRIIGLAMICVGVVFISHTT